MTRATIAQLVVYPVKGCRGVAVDTATATVRGLASGALTDREWMIVDGANRFVTQREHPRLALIAVSASGAGVALRAPAMPTIDVASPDVDSAPRRDVVVWQSTVAAIDGGDDIARWLGAYLGMPARLVRFAPEHVRACNREFVGASGAHTMFADGYPLLVISQASLDALNARLADRGVAPVPMNRFRPNVVVAGLDAHDEDHVDTLEVAGVTLRMVKPCVRCQVPATNQDDATVGTEPNATLAGYRMNERFGGVTFGVNAIVASGAGRALAVGDEARIEFRF